MYANLLYSFRHDYTVRERPVLWVCLLCLDGMLPVTLWALRMYCVRACSVVITVMNIERWGTRQTQVAVDRRR